MSAHDISSDMSHPSASGSNGEERVERWNDASRIWIFPLLRRLEASEKQALEAKLARFIGGWTAHKQQVHGGSFFHRDWFLAIVADTTGATTSGCSIDSMTREVEQLLNELSLTGGDASDLFYLAEGEVVRISRARFRELAASGVINGDTIVFDTTLTTLAPFRAGQFERLVKDSWHRRLAGIS